MFELSFLTTLGKRPATGQLIRCRFNRHRGITIKELLGSLTVRLPCRVGQGWYGGGGGRGVVRNDTAAIGFELSLERISTASSSNGTVGLQAPITTSRH